MKKKYIASIVFLVLFIFLFAIFLWQQRKLEIVSYKIIPVANDCYVLKVDTNINVDGRLILSDSTFPLIGSRRLDSIVQTKSKTHYYYVDNQDDEQSVFLYQKVGLFGYKKK